MENLTNSTLNAIREIKLQNADDQQQLNDLVVQRINKKIQLAEPTIEKTLERFESEGKLMRDFIVPIGSRVADGSIERAVQFSANGSVKMDVIGKNGGLQFTEHSLLQIGTKYGIPVGYLKSLNASDWGRQLSATILNQHSDNIDRERVLIRTVGSQIRGVLSDQYRRLDSTHIIRAFITALSGSGAILCDAHMNDTKIFLEAILPTPIQIQTPNNGTVFIAFGVRLSNSDYGDGALQLRTFMMQGVCLNGMVSDSVLKQVHLGARLPDDLQLSQQTYELDSQTNASAVNDLTTQLLSRETITMRSQQIIRASATEIDLQKEIKHLSKIGMSKDETGEVERIMLNNDLNDGVQGQPTLWKLSQGITAHARKVEQSRSRELQEIAGQLIQKI